MAFYNEVVQADSTYLLINAEKIASKPDFMNADKLDIKNCVNGLLKIRIYQNCHYIFCGMI